MASQHPQFWIIFLGELAISYQNREDLAHTPAIGATDNSIDDQSFDDQNKLLKIVKDITSKGFVRNNYKKNLVDLSDVKINLKRKKINYFFDLRIKFNSFN